MIYFNLSNLLFLHGKKDGISLEILFTYSASRFSRKDITPSAASSDAPLESIALLSIICASSGLDAEDMSQIICLVKATETGAVFEMSLLAIFDLKLAYYGYSKQPLFVKEFQR